jgi:hypothetical protein
MRVISWLSDILRVITALRQRGRCCSTGICAVCLNDVGTGLGGANYEGTLVGDVIDGYCGIYDNTMIRTTQISHT